MPHQFPATNQLVLIVVAGLGLLAALFIGSSIGSANVTLVALLISVIPVFVTVISLKQMIWVLIPIGWFLNNRIGALPLPLSVQDITIIASVSGFALLVIMRQVPAKTVRTLLDNVVYLNLAYIITVFIRHPAGFFFFQTEQVGGRAYISVLLAFAAYLVLSRATLTPFLAKIWPLFTIVPLLFGSMLAVTARLLPSLAPVLTAIYGQPSTGVEQAVVIGEERLPEVQTLGTMTILALVSVYPPLSLINPMYPGRVFLLLLGLSAIFLSGFRLAIMAGVVYFVLSLVLRRQLAGLWIFATMLAASFLTLIALQNNQVLELPFTVQRTLSFLPGAWDPDAKRDASESTQWRLEMWKYAWEDDRILRDKVWGQGFGLSLADMQIEAATRTGGRSEGSGFIGGAMQEWWLINGAFHNGPLSAIRNVGVVGLFLYVVLIITSVKVAWSICLQTKSTYLFAMALFITIPIIWEAFRFVFLYGHYPAAICLSLYWAGLINLLRNNIPAMQLPTFRSSGSKTAVEAVS